MHEIVVGVAPRHAPPLPPEIMESYDLLLTGQPKPARPWVGVSEDRLDRTLAALESRVQRCPIAARVFTQLLRASNSLPFDHALFTESLAYSMLLQGVEFKRWRYETPVRRVKGRNGGGVQIARVGDRMEIVLDRPEVHNAFSAQMRDRLSDALATAMAAADVSEVSLRGRGPSFCSGGDLDEFGSAADVSVAHFIRTHASVALRAMALRSRLRVHLRGASIGAGIEIAAAAGAVIATADAWMQLPEIGMGLVPGAGGTVTIPRRIGRHRCAFMGLTGERIDSATALHWGLVDEVS